MAAQTPAKGMSSRLLTMKFMQRAAATSSPASSPTTPNTDDSSSKRRKISHNPSTNPDLDSLVDRQAIQAAMEEGERKREEALVRQAAESGDARWVLNIPENTQPSVSGTQKPLQVVQVGFAQIDYSDIPFEDHAASSDEDSQDRVPPIRRYNMGKKKSTVEASDSDDSDSYDSDSSNASSSDGEGGGKSSTPSGKQGSTTPRSFGDRRTVEKAKAKELADKRRKREVNLNKARPQARSNGPSSLSSGGGLLSLSSGGRPMSTTQRQSGSSSLKCYNCGETGHRQAECQKARQRTR